MGTLTRDIRTTIGASEVPAILGLSPFQTPLKLWSIKTGRVEPSEQNEAMEWGNRLERVVSEKFAELHGVKLMAYKKRYVHPTMPFFSCELDNIIVGTDELVEIKTVNANAWKKWASQDDIPDYVVAQVMAQLGLSGRRVGWVACLCGGQKYVEKRIEFNVEFYERVEKAVAEFWKLVETKTPPAAVAEDNEELVDIYPQTTEQIQHIEELNAKIASLQEIKMHLEQLDIERDGLEAELKQVIGDGLGFKTSDYMVTWKAQKNYRFDTKEFKFKEPDLYQNYVKESVSRTLRINKNKENGNNGKQ